MNTIPVYRKGAWISYTIPEANRSLWSQSLKLRTASVYATAMTKGYTHESSTVFAECFANKELYGVKYNSQIESVIQGFFV